MIKHGLSRFFVFILLPVTGMWQNMSRIFLIVCQLRKIQVFQKILLLTKFHLQQWYTILCKEIFQCSMIRFHFLWFTQHTNPEDFENANKTGGIWKRRLSVLAWTKTFRNASPLEMTDYCRILKFIRHYVHGIHFMPFQSENTLFKFIRQSGPNLVIFNKTKMSSAIIIMSFRNHSRGSANYKNPAWYL